MRIVLRNHAEVAHKWANQAQSNGRSSDGRMFFEGPSIYSYGHHFEIARFTDKTYKGERVILFTTRRYSVSTSNHIGHVSHAIPSNVRYFCVPAFGDSDHAENVRHYLKAAEEARAAAVRAVKYSEMHERSATVYIRDAADYCVVYKKEVPAAERKAVKALLKTVEAGALFTDAERAKIAARLAAGRKAEAEKKARAAAAEAERLAAWAAHAPDARGPFYHSRIVLRLSADKSRVETSRGAQITERAARGLWAVLLRKGDEQTSLIGLNLDGYTVRKWDGVTLTVGCHEIPAAELRKIAAEMGLSGAL